MFSQQVDVLFEVHRVFFKIRRVIKLRRVHKYAAYRQAALLLGLLKKRKMTLVQGPHGGHKTNQTAKAMYLGDIGA